MVTTNILQRTFHLRFRGSSGTCFTIDFEGRHYVVTAAHVVEGIQESDDVELFQSERWHRLTVRRVGVSTSPADVAVLAPAQILSPLHPLDIRGIGYYLSQDVYFLGFPYGLQMDLKPELNRGFPLPLVKKGIISALASNQSGPNTIFLDGHNNPGFSGGPVVYTVPNRPKELNVCAIISGFRSEEHPVFLEGQATQLSWRYNTGIIVATDICAATTLIRSNPIGFELPAQTMEA